MTIWAYLIVGLLYAISFWMIDSVTTNPEKLGIRIVWSVLFWLLWPLNTVAIACIAIWCRKKPEHRVKVDFVEKN